MISDAHALLDAAPDALLVVDAEGLIVLVNHQAESLFGYARADIIGQSVEVLLPSALRAAHVRHRADFAATPRVRPMGSGRQLRAVRRDGSELPAEVSLSPVTLATGPHVIAAVRDLTERQRTEEALITAAITLDSIADAVIATDRLGSIRFMNRVAEALVGWSLSEARGRPVDEVAVLIEEQGGAVRSWLAPAFTPGTRSADLRGVLLRARDGKTRAIADSIAPIIDQSGETTGVVWVFRDVTEQRRLEAQVLVADRMTSLGIMATGLAHELNNPLTSVVAHLEFACEWLEARLALSHDESLREPLGDLDEARRGANRMRTLVRDVAYFSQGSPGDEPLDVNRVLESALRVVPPELRRGVEIVRSFGALPSVMANESRLGQVFLNLLVNAFQAVPRVAPGAARVVITTGRAPRGAVFVEIADNGPGMTPELRDRIFTPFFTTRPAGGGTGLGLAICHAIVQSLDGEISVQTSEGNGASFRVTLPAARVVADDRCPAQATHVLVVDDEPGIAHAVARLLEREHQVTTAGSAEDALAAVRRHGAFDAIVSDLNLPGMSGMALYDTLAAEVPGQADAMVFMTGARSPAVESFFARVKNVCIEKPFQGDTMRAAVREVVRRHPK